MKVDFKSVEGVFIDSVKEQAEIYDREPSDIVLVLFPQEQRPGRFATRVLITSISKKVPESIVKLRKLTLYDMTGHISKAIMKIFEFEVSEHNEGLDKGILKESHKNIKEPITLKGLECYITIEKDEESSTKWKLNMNMIYNYKLLRVYDIEKEFGDVAKEVDM